jgi:Ca-activated chloride channel family protein
MLFRKLVPLILLPFLLIFSLPVRAQKDDDKISIDSSIVVLNAYVTDSAGSAVEGLNQKLFKVFEDGVEQRIDTFGAESTPFAAVILLDTSGSMEERVTLARSAAIQFLGGVRGEDNVAIYNFDSKVQLVQDFSNRGDMNDKAFDLKADGMTSLNDAVYKASQLLSIRPEKRRAIIVLSDGADTSSKYSEDKALKAALSVNASIYTVDMSPMVQTGPDKVQNQGVLKNFAEKTGGRFVSTPGGSAMREAFKRIVEELGSQYTIAYSPTNIVKDGKWHAIELRISRPGLAIRTRKGYNAPKAKN